MKKKTIVAILIIVITVLAVGGAIAAGVTLSPVRGTPNTDVWVPTLPVDDYIVTISKQEDKPFQVLNLADIQFGDFHDIGKRTFTEDTIRAVIAETEPDLITLTGDQVWTKHSKYSIRHLVSFLDSFGIPWAPVMGNHDAEGNADAQYIADLYLDAEHCLFRKEPSNIGGVGNYVINIMEGNRIFHSLIMMDSGMGRNYSALGQDAILSYELDDDFELKRDGAGNPIEREIGHNFDFLSIGQIAWYRSVVERIKLHNQSAGGGVPTSSLFLHIPLPEYYIAYVDYLLSGKDPSYGVFGALREDVCCAKINSGMFDALLEEGSTKFVFAGHDHVNDLSILYKGIRLTYGLKTGDRCYFEEGVNGGTLMTIGDTVEIRHVYVNP